MAFLETLQLTDLGEVSISINVSSIVYFEPYMNSTRVYFGNKTFIDIKETYSQCINKIHYILYK